MIGLCSPDARVNGTAVHVEWGNPGEVPYQGEGRKGDAVLQRIKGERIERREETAQQIRRLGDVKT